MIGAAPGSAAHAPGVPGEAAPPKVTIEPEAVEYLMQLLARQPEPGCALRIAITHPGTSQAHGALSFRRPEHAGVETATLDAGGLRLYYDPAQRFFLDGTRVAMKKTFGGRTLAIDMPRMRELPPVDASSPLLLRVTYVLESEVNPALAEHDGGITCEQIAEGGIAVLKFAGGCQGCGRADATLHEWVAKILLARLPELSAVADITEHDKGTRPYIPRG